MSIHEMLVEAGELLKQRYTENTKHSIKERYHLLSEVDIEIDELLCKSLKEANPNFSIHSEESTHLESEERAKWIVDPIDGTTNFIMGNPFFAISIALEKNGQIVEGHVYNPLTNEYFSATEEEPTTLFNGAPIFTSETAMIEDALIAFGYSANMKIIQDYYRNWKNLFDTCRKGIGWVAPALSICNVARGRIDAFIDTGSSIYGQSAAGLILRKSGGALFNADFSPYSHDETGGIFCNTKIVNNLKAIYKA